MSKIITEYNYTIPHIYATAIQNADISGLSAEDIEEINSLEECFNLMVKENNGSHWTLDCIDEDNYNYDTKEYDCKIVIF